MASRGSRPFLRHDSLDVFDDHDGVVHEQADGQRHAEHGQGIDRKSERGEDPERAQQHHRDGDGRDQRGARVLQEHEHHEEYQYDRLDQRLDHFEDRSPDERSRVERIDHLEAAGEERLQPVDRGVNGVDGIERVLPRREPDGHAGRRLAVVFRVARVTFGIERDARDVADAHLRAVGVDAQQDIAELLRRGQARRPDDARADRLARGSRKSADRADGNLHVLRTDGGDHVAGGEAEVIELRGIQPDAHRILRTEHLHVADARRAIQRIENVGRDVVGQILVAHAAIGGDETHHHEEVARRFVHPDAGLLDFLRQQRHRSLQLVLNLHLRGVRHRALRERQRDRRGAVGIGLGGDVGEVVDAVQRLLDDLDHRVLHRLRGGARVVHVDAH